jgi:hypothetical protein
MLTTNYSRNKANQSMKSYTDNQKIATLTPLYEGIRTDLIKAFDEIVITDKRRESYILDVEFGLFIYEYFKEKIDMRIASSDDFWMHLSVEIIPDIVAKRWGLTNEDHFWKMSRRIWLKQIWWYVHLTWNTSMEETRSILMTQNMNTDIILNLVERSGRKGYFIDVQRLIVKCYSNLPYQYEEASRNIFRKIMILNTAKSLTIEPSLCVGGVDGYVKKLYSDLNIDVL